VVVVVICICLAIRPGSVWGRTKVWHREARCGVPEHVGHSLLQHPPYRSSYMVDYEALVGLSLLRVPQQSVWLGAPRA
jgi:hypothetical protein